MYFFSLKRFILLSLFVLLLPNKIKSEECLFQDCTCEFKHFTQDYDVLCTSKSPPLYEYLPARNPSSNIANINTLLINYYDIKRTPASFFSGLSIRSLILVGNNLETLTYDTFKSIKYLNSLTVVEPRLTLIENNTFNALSYMLDELVIARLDSIPEYKLNSFMNEFEKLKKLRKLSLIENGLTSFDKNVISGFPLLQELKLTYNKLKFLPVDTFNLNKNLKIIDLSRNEFTIISDILNVLEPIKHGLEQLFLSSNQFALIPEIGNYSNLTHLDLSSNKINETKPNAFKTLNNLSFLNLGKNYLENIDSNAFLMNENLEILLINDNLLKNLPNIYNLNKLSLLDVENQNKNLKILSNYFFERRMDAKKVTVNLKGNDVGFENKTFCPQNKNNLINIRKLMFSYQTLKNLDKCILKQLVSNFYNMDVLIEIDNPPIKTNYEELCSCDFKNFAKNLSISLNGICDDIFNMSCNETFIDECSQKLDYQCLYSNNITTTNIIIYTTTVSNSLSALQLRNVASKIKIQNFYLLFLFIFFLFII